MWPKSSRTNFSGHFPHQRGTICFRHTSCNYASFMHGTCYGSVCLSTSLSQAGKLMHWLSSFLAQRLPTLILHCKGIWASSKRRLLPAGILSVTPKLANRCERCHLSSLTTVACLSQWASTFVCNTTRVMHSVMWFICNSWNVYIVHYIFVKQKRLWNIPWNEIKDNEMEIGGNV